MADEAKMKYWLKVAESAAKGAFKSVRKDKENIRKVEHNFERDVKIAADRKLESFILPYLRAKTGLPILSEESGIIPGRNNAGGFRWIVDPLDGTLNFSRGIPISCISIALWQGMEPLIGVIYDFNRNECFQAIAGKGAWLNGAAISVSNIEKKNKAVLATGLPSDFSFTVKNTGKLVRDFIRFKKVRLIGSAALSLAYVACARMDMYVENNIKLWDVAAGIVLVKAAGGKVELEPSNKAGNFIIKAANRRLLD